ncbi:MAG: ribonuclease HI [Candidatus Asgardarchaeia archaeon]
MIRVFFDGACKPKNKKGVATYSFLIYKDDTLLAKEWGLAAEPNSEYATVHTAEYVGMVKALEWLVEHKITDYHVQIYGDNIGVIKQLKGELGVSSKRIKPLYRKAQRLLTNFKSYDFVWIPRYANEDAINLTRRAIAEYLIKRNQELAKKISPLKITSLGERLYIVEGYQVDLNRMTCTCKFYKSSNRMLGLQVKIPCKHIFAAQRFEEEQKKGKKTRLTN